MNEKHPRVGIGIFVFKDHRFIMGCRKGSHGEGTWSVPGGHLDFGEKIEKGAAREVKEETGLEIKNIAIAGITNDIFEDEEKHYITIWITSEWKKGVPKITEPDKFHSLDWYTFDDLPERLFLPWIELKKSMFYKDIKKLLRKS